MKPGNVAFVAKRQQWNTTISEAASTVDFRVNIVRSKTNYYYRDLGLPDDEDYDEIKTIYPNAGRVLLPRENQPALPYCETELNSPYSWSEWVS